VNDLKLGEEQYFEVWFIPANRQVYAPYVIQTYDLLDKAQAYRENIAPLMLGTMEIIRVRTMRQLLMSAVP
jgi:hypothetical protein